MSSPKDKAYPLAETGVLRQYWEAEKTAIQWLMAEGKYPLPIRGKQLLQGESEA